MPIEFFCQTCHAKLRTPDATAGKMVRCPKCGQLERIPSDQFVASDPSQSDSERADQEQNNQEDKNLTSPSISSSDPSYRSSPLQNSTSNPGGSTNPYSRPVTDSHQPVYRYQPTGAQVRQRIAIPGIFMIVLSTIGILIGLFGVVSFLFVAVDRGVRDNDLFSVIWAVPISILSCVSFAGGISMVRVKGYYLAMAGSIAMFISGLLCCFLPLPIAIWSLVVLISEDSKNLFR